MQDAFEDVLTHPKIAETDRDFLGRMFAQYPAIGENFRKCLALPSGVIRPWLVLQITREIKRSGWIKRGIKSPESVFAHQANVLRTMSRAMILFQNLPDDQDMLFMAAAHDITEALIGDFRPDENFNKQDKIRLEKIAARQIFTTPDQAGMIALIDEYAEQKTPRAKTVRDFDMLDAMECALQYEGRYPEKMGIFEEFKAYTEPKLYSEAGKAYFEKLETNQAIIRQLAADILRDEPASRTRI